MSLSVQEQQWLEKMRVVRDCLYVGIDHHGAQLTVAVATGAEIIERSGDRHGFSWIKTRVFAQDGQGYLDLLDYLATTHPEVAPERYRFLSEPSYAKPCGLFLLNNGFSRSQVLWVDTRKVSQYRKAHHLGASGKNDPEDARTMVAMLYRAASEPSGPIRLFEVPPLDMTAETLAGLSEEHRRLTQQSVQLQAKIFQKVLLLFPEVRRVWGKIEKARKQDGSEYTKVKLNLFEGVTPLRVLYHFPSAQKLGEAGFDAVWSVVGGKGVSKRMIRELLGLAGLSAGIGHEVYARQLRMLIDEYWDIQHRLTQYEEEMATILKQDEVLESFQQIKFLSVQAIATIVGAIGEVSRFENVDQVKRYLNIAPQPMPQSGEVDERGRPIQDWRLPANSYTRVNGQKQLKYRHPGRQDVRKACYIWFSCMFTGRRQAPESPYVQLLMALKSSHQGKTRWVGRIRWKVIAKLVETLYYCLKYRRAYDPGKVIVNVPNAA